MKTCPSCFKKYLDEWNSCRECATVLVEGEVSGTPADISDKRECHFCRSMINRRASVCPHCQKDISFAGALNSFSNNLLGLLFWGAVLVLMFPALYFFFTK